MLGARIEERSPVRLRLAPFPSPRRPATNPARPRRVVGNWKLDELLEATQTYELWTAKPLFGGSNARPMRLKRYLLDPLLTGELRQAQIGWRRG